MKTDTWTDSQQACELLARQRRDWAKAGDGYLAMEQAEIKECRIDSNITVMVQYNPMRAVSTLATVNYSVTPRKRGCFLCSSVRPAAQEELPMGDRYVLLCNPYPIFDDHFTIASRRHMRQQILPYFADFLKMAQHLSAFTLFYNGPQSGASRPDHLHFQAVTRSCMPIEKEIASHKANALLSEGDAVIYPLKRYIRNGYVIEADSAAGACVMFKRLHKTLVHCVKGDPEPRMNIFCIYDAEAGRWQVTVIPRAAHRPRQYFSNGSDQTLVSPGAADIGGFLITVRRTDFERMTPGLLSDIYRQVSFPDYHIDHLSDYLLSKP